MISRNTSPHILLLLHVILALIAFLFSVSIALGAEATSPCPYTWERNLKVGMTGTDVLKLQQFLNADPLTEIASSGAGSPGQESTYLGQKTANALAKFQEKYKTEVLTPAGLSKGSGFVGTLTRTKLNSLCSSVDAFPLTPLPVSSQSTVTEQTAITSSAKTLAVTVPEQPSATLAPPGAGWVPFTNITLTAENADVTVNAMTVQRSGFGADGAFDSVQLADENGNPIGVTRSFRSNHMVTLGKPFIIRSGESKTITVMGNMASDLANFDGQMPMLQINSIDTDAIVSGPLPVRGTYQTINNSLTIGTAHASVSSYDPGSATNKYINDRGVRFSGVRFSADSKEDLELSSIIWDQTGTAGNGDFANIRTVVNGVAYPAVADGKKFTSTFDPPIVIKKGNSVDVHVEGDLTTSGANRTVEFDIHESGDVSLLGKSFGYYVLVVPDSGTATSGHSVFVTSDGTTDGDEGSPFFSGSIVTINAGTFTTIGK